MYKCVIKFHSWSASFSEVQEKTSEQQEEAAMICKEWVLMKRRAGRMISAGMDDIFK